MVCHHPSSRSSPRRGVAGGGGSFPANISLFNSMAKGVHACGGSATGAIRQATARVSTVRPSCSAFNAASLALHIAVTSIW